MMRATSTWAKNQRKQRSISLPAICIAAMILFSHFATPTLAVTPRPPKGKLFATAPEECLLFLHNFGFTAANPKSTNKTEQLVLEPSVQNFITEVKSLANQAMKKAVDSTDSPEEAAVMTELFDLGKMLIDRPFTFYISDVTIGQFGPEDVNMGLVVDAGESVAEVEKRLLALQSRMPEALCSDAKVAGVDCHCITPPEGQGPPIHWGKVGSYLLVAVGTDAMESLMANVKGKAPGWLEPAVDRIDVPRRWVFAYANIEKLNESVNEFSPPDFQRVMTAFGWNDISAISIANGLDDEGMLSRWLVSAKSDQGLLGLFDKNGLSAKDLEEVPKEAVGCIAMRLDPATVVEKILELAAEVDPDEGADLQVQLDGFSDAIGVDIRKDIMAGLGDRWIVYSLPGNAGPMAPDAVIAVDVRDATGVQQGLNVLKKFVNAQDGMISISETKVGDRAAYYLKGAPIAPAWCLTKDRLVIAMQKSSIGKLLDSPPAATDSLAANSRVTSMLAEFEKPMMISYGDANASMSAMYQALPMLLNMASGGLEQQGIEFDATNLPPLEDILKHLDASVGVVHRAKDGIEFVSRKTMPSVGVGTATPVLVALLLPAVQGARGAARRASSMNNMKQIGLACHNFHSATSRFPAAKIGKDEKFGLSWRVAILPYMEENELYGQFHLDEPWDSEHNKTLIAKMPQVYQSPRGKADKGKTNYLAIAGESSVLTGEGEGISMREITDGTSKTIMAVEVDDARAVTWTKPDDHEWDDENPIHGLGGLQNGGFLSLFTDGSVRIITDNIDEDTLKALFTKDGGEVIENF